MVSLVFLLDDSNLQGIDCSDVTQGNPGMGGTEYLFVALAHELASRGLARVTLAHFSASNAYPDSLRRVRLDYSIDTPRSWPSDAGEADFIIARAYNVPLMHRVITAIPGTAPIIVWAHNHRTWQTYSYLAECERVRRVVYVGREQAALAAGAACRTKASYIPNGFYPPPPVKAQRRDKRAVYVGNLVPQKGFHRLARLWPLIHRHCPDAVLDVIGDGRLYGGNEPLGPMGLTEPRYERKILGYLGNDPSKYGVIFHGKLGRSKFEVMSQSLLGLPNPTGFTECCPGSVLELSACGNAVVAPKRWGMCDTVVDGATGYLCSTEAEYVMRAVTLLGDTDGALAMGRAGQEFVSRAFAFGAVCAQWHDLLEGLRGGGHVPQLRESALLGDYPFRRLRRLSGRPRLLAIDAALCKIDRAHGWMLRNL